MLTNCLECLYIHEDQYEEDFYDIEHQTVIFRILFNSVPKYVEFLNDQLKSCKIRRIAKAKSAYYNLMKCSRGTYHLVNKKNGKVVPMLHKTVDLLKSIHYPDHSNLVTMRKAERKLGKYDYLILKYYTYGYIEKC